MQVTHTALATPEVLSRLCPSKNASPFQRFIRDLLLFFASTYKVRHAAVYGMCRGLVASSTLCATCAHASDRGAHVLLDIEMHPTHRRECHGMCSGDNLTPFSQDVFGFDSPPLHDSTAVAYVIDPSLFQVGPTLLQQPHTTR